MGYKGEQVACQQGGAWAYTQHPLDDSVITSKTWAWSHVSLLFGGAHTLAQRGYVLMPQSPNSNYGAPHSAGKLEGTNVQTYHLHEHIPRCAQAAAGTHFCPVCLGPGWELNSQEPTEGESRVNVLLKAKAPQ